MARYLRSPQRFLREQHTRFGDAFRQRFIGSGTWTLFSTPEAARALLTAPTDIVRAGIANEEVLGALVGRMSLLTLDGSAHLARRKLLLPSLRGERMHMHGDAIIALATKLVHTWPEHAALSLLPEFQKLTLNVIMRVVFGLDETSAHHELRRMLTRVVNECLGSPLLLIKPLQWDLGRLSPWGRIVRILRRTHELLTDEIRRRRHEDPRQDILSLLLAVRTEEGERLSDSDLRDELISLLIAGQETTSSSTAWLFERLLSNPPALARIKDELESVCGAQPLAAEHLTKLPYLDAAIRESLRMRSIFANTSVRILSEDLDIAGHQVKKGEQVSISAAVLHFRPELYSDPWQFLPERFLTKTPDPYQWIPFGGGTRRCIGMQIALYQMKAITSAILRRVNLKLDGPVEETTRGFMMAPKGGLRVRLSARLD